jgi:hypothetical protein
MAREILLGRVGELAELSLDVLRGLQTLDRSRPGPGTSMPGRMS